MIANYIKYIIHIIITSTKDFIRVNLRVTQIDNAAAITSLQDFVKTVQIPKIRVLFFCLAKVYRPFRMPLKTWRFVPRRGGWLSWTLRIMYRTMCRAGKN